jgi:hypothetical protein
MGRDLKVFSRTTGQEKLTFTCKLSDRVQIQICLDHGPRRSGGATIGKTIFTCILLQDQQINFNQTWYKSFLYIFPLKDNSDVIILTSKFGKIKGQALLVEGEMITKVQEWDGVIKKSSHEPWAKKLNFTRKLPDIV